MTCNKFAQIACTILLSLASADDVAQPGKQQANDIDTAQIWQYQGCWSDSVQNRTLAVMAEGGSGVSNDNCQALCSQLGYRLAGTEYAGECYCGDQLNGLSQQIDPADCNMACKHNASQLCGGPDALDMYWNGTGTPLVASDHGTTTTSSIVEPTVSETTSTSPTATLSSSSDPDTVVSPPTSNPPSSVPGDTSTSSTVSMPPSISEASSITESIITPTSAVPITSTTSTSSSETVNPTTTITSSPTTITTTSPTSTAPTPTMVTTNLPNGFAFRGCYVDSLVNRILAVQQPDSNSLTVESCINTCSSLGYGIAGVEWQVQCFCGNSILNGGYLATSPYAQLSCRKACSGDPSEACGGRFLMAVYSQGTGLL